MNFSDSIFKIHNLQEFNFLALEIFKFQAENNKVYNKYLEELKIDYREVKTVEEIPFLPVELFKNHKIVSSNQKEVVVFTSSGTTNSIQSKHYVTDVAVYENSFKKGFEFFYDSLENCNIYALLPSYLEREGSSLIYMVEGLMKDCFDSGFFLYNYEDLIQRLNRRDKSKKTILIGVTFALLDLVEKYDIDLSENVYVMETGGMKGRRKELPREELHSILTQKLHVKSIHSEYGMCEALSQSYSDGNGIFISPQWMKILIRDVNDPSEILDFNKRGAINIIDLANFNSCSFLATKDLGKRFENGTFTVEGRIDNSDIRGCNLLI
ncbi:MAG: acyltransferase [Rikenellaceae bacterium]